MKKRILLGAFGLGLVAGTGVYILLKHINKNASDDQDERALDKNTEGFDDVKEQSISSISDRHKKAAEVTRQAMENINDNIEVVSDHKDEFDSMKDELDNL